MGSMLELESQVKELKQKLLTHEISTGLFMVDIVRILESLKPGLTDKLLKHWKERESMLPESDARNDPHTIDAFKRIIKTLETASKK